MKKCLFFLVMFSGISVLAQLPQKLKYDQLSYSADSATVLIMAGKTMSVYDLVNARYLIQPTRNRLINFPGSNQYAEIPLKGGPICIHATYMQTVVSICGSDSLCSLGFMNPEMGSYIVSANGRAYDSKGEKYTGQKVSPELEWGSCSISKQGNFYFITNSQGEYYTPGYPGERNYVPAFSESGVYDLTENQWAIEPIYQTFTRFMNCFFGLREIVYDSGRKEFVYDIYHLENGELMQIKTDVQEVDEGLLYKLLDADTLVESTATGYYVFSKFGQGSGLLKFTLFADENYTVPDLSYQILLEPVADFVFYEPYYQKVAAVFRDSLEKLWIYHVDVTRDSLILLGRDSFSVHYNWEENYSGIAESITTSLSHFQVVQDSGKIIRTEYSGRKSDNFRFGIGLNYLDDSLIHFSNSFPGYGLAVIGSKSYPGEDSLDADGNVVYSRRDKPFAKSGIYNLSKNQWLIFPQYDVIYAGSGKFMCLDENDQFSCFDSLGNLEISGIEREGIYQNPDHLKLFVPYKNPKKIFEAPGGFWHHSQLNNLRHVYYVEFQNKLGLYSPGNWSFLNEIPNMSADFIHYNPALQFTFILKNDSIHFLKEGYSYVVSQEFGKILYVQPVQNNDPVDSYELTLIEKGDTGIIGNYLSGYDSYTFSSIEKRGNLLIVNDHTTRVENSCVECFDESGTWISYREGHFESENSSIWKNTETGWQKMSPYYATVQMISNGWFIASSGHFYQDIDYGRNFGSPHGNKTERADFPARYFLLDSSFHAIPFLDYFDFPHIEDLGFGIKIKLDNGYYFFVTYDGVAVTDAAWHHFEMERGKLKAILNTTYMYDEDGNQMLDEFGYPVEATTETIKYFKLP